MSEPQRLNDLRERFLDVLQAVRQRLSQENRRFFDEVLGEVETQQRTASDKAA